MMYLNEKGTTGVKETVNLPLFIMLLTGIAVRLFHFFYNRSLWMDEVYLATSLVKMNYADLLTMPLFYQQKAPIGFLLFVKTIINLFGNKELYLRAIPLISGIASLCLFIPIAKYFLKKWGVYLAMAIFCFAPALVYHSVEIKQYSTELLGTVLCLSLYIRYKKSNKQQSMFLWGALGATILWFSYSSIFILAGIAVGISLQHIIKKNWSAFFLNAIPFIIWLLSFCINYVLFTHKHAESEWIVYWFRAYGNFAPILPKSLEDLMWFPKNLYRMLDYPLGLLWNFNSYSNSQGINILLKMPFIGITLLLLGAYILIKRFKANSYVLIPPILFTFAASGLELYPLTERFWIFLSPIFIIIIAMGFDYLTNRVNSTYAKSIFFIIAISAPIFQSAKFVINPKNFYVHKKSFQREALMYVNNQIKPGDMVYVYWNNLPGYRLYNEIYHFNFTAIEGKDIRKRSTDFKNYYYNLTPDFQKFSTAKRIWLIFNTKFLTDIGDMIDDPKWYYTSGVNPTNQLLNEFSKIGSPIKKYTSVDITVYLFEFQDKAKRKL